MEQQKLKPGGQASSAFFEAVLTSAVDAIIMINDKQNIAFFNPAAEAMFGMEKGEAIGQPLANLIPEASREGHMKHVQLFRDTGVTARKMGTLAVSGRRKNGETFRIEASISQANIDSIWLATVILRDITERIATEEARELLSQEVDHRAKNALAVVQAIVQLTTAESTEQYIEAISGRLDTLARAHSLLAKGSWTGGDLREIIHEEVIGFQATGQVTYDGPRVKLSVKSVQPLSMLFHELATNAVKHGALSAADGTVAIRWYVDPAGSLILRWTEIGGPLVPKPERAGFGSSLINSLGDQLRGQGSSNWLPGGLEFTIELPPAAFKAEGPQMEGPSDVPDNNQDKKIGRRVLVVEDEAIVALVLAAGLRSDGWEVIGPASTIKGAYRLLADGLTPDVAVLDINLDDTAIYPLAQLLQERNIPFVFYSGYLAPALDARFKDVPLIGKPARVHVIVNELSRLIAQTSVASTI